MVVTTFFASCREYYPASSSRGVLYEGHEEGTGVTVEVDHPDGRTTEAIEVSGPGIRELCQEFPKEPGSWGLRLISKGGAAAYWVALHDRKKYIGPDEDVRRFVESE